MGYWAANLDGPKCVACLFLVVRVNRVPRVYTRITRNKFGFLEVLPEIEFGYFGFGYFGFGYRVRQIVPRAIKRIHCYSVMQYQVLQRPIEIESLLT